LRNTGAAFGIWGVPIARDAALIEAGGDLQLSAQTKIGNLFMSATRHNAQGPLGQGKFYLAVLTARARGVERSGVRSQTTRSRGSPHDLVAIGATRWSLEADRLYYTCHDCLRVDRTDPGEIECQQ